MEETQNSTEVIQQPQTTKKSHLWITILIVFLAIVLSSAGTYYFLSNNSQKNQNQNPVVKVSQVKEIEETTSQPQPTITPMINNDNFISNDLGISFNYDKTQAQVKQVGSKVYVYANNINYKPEDGQWVEVFAKDKNDSLLDAIKKKFLANYSPDDCFVETVSENAVAGETYPAFYQLARITVPHSANDDLETLSKKWSKCPALYTTENGVSYFLIDTNYPDKFVYLSIGQYGISSGIGNKSWQSTIKFIK